MIPFSFNPLGNFKVDTPVADDVSIFSINVTSPLSIIFPILNRNGSYTIDWGDSTTSSNTSAHQYSSAGTYTVTIAGTFTSLNFSDLGGCAYLQEVKLLGNHKCEGMDFAMCINLTKISKITKGIFSKMTSVKGFLYGCYELENIPDSIFNECGHIKNFSMCFFDCQSLSTIPETIFDNCISAEDFSYCFQECHSTTHFPTTLFNNCIQAKDFTQCFYNCVNSQIIPSFDNNINATTFDNCFALNYKLTGIAPALWLRTPTPTGGGCFYDCTKLDNYSSIPEDWK